MNKTRRLINELEDMIRVSPKEIYVWSGSGYVLDTINATDYLGDREEISIEEVAWLCLQTNSGEVIAEDTFRDLVKEVMYFDKVDEETARETLEEEYCYCDLTTFDNVPEDYKICYLLIDNMRCSDNLEIHS